MTQEAVTNAVEETIAPETNTMDDAIGTEGTEGTPESISLQDLQLLGQIVDLASQRGAFRGNELTQVGTIYDKLSAFLGFVAEQQAENAEEGDAPAEEGSSEEA